jgi:alpha-mannosidase
MIKKNNKPECRSAISRREFINYTLAGVGTLAFPFVRVSANDKNQQQALWPKDASKFKIHMIGHGHIDAVWLWPWSEGISVVMSTFRSALDKMNEFPDFVFSCSSAQFYQWVAENDSEMLDEIRKRIDEGRWNVVGGWWVEPDVNIPSGEAIVRQGLYGQLTLQKLVGRRAKTAFNPDSFGHMWTLPQILKQQGMNDYVFMRPMKHEKNLPSDLFWWEGLDGTHVLCYRIQIHYNDYASVRKRLEQIIEHGDSQPMKNFMSFYGIGDHGGGITKENVLSINELKKEKGVPYITYSTVEKYFDEVRADKKIAIPIVKDDLQIHAVGCYTAECEIKKANRHSEIALITAEKAALIGSIIWNANYPREELTEAWKRVLFLQFHDSLAGTSLPEHSRAAREGYGYALDTARRSIYMSMQKLEWQIPSEDPDSEYLVVFNPHAWEVNENIEYIFKFDLSLYSSEVTDEKGNLLPHQWVDGKVETGPRQFLVCNVTIPPMGYRQIKISKISPVAEKKALVKEKYIENEYYRIYFEDNGALGIFDKENQKELFSGGAAGCKAVVINDTSDTWSHDVTAFLDEIGAFGNAQIKMLENGHLRKMIRVTSTYGNSTLAIDWALYAGSRNIEARVTLDWHERRKMLKFSFPVNVESPKATLEISYGYIERSGNGAELPGQRWIDVSGNGNEGISGLTVINDAKYGYSVIRNDIRLSIARSAVYAHHDPKALDPDREYTWMDQGIQTFRMLLVPHKETWRENNITRLAEEFTAPAMIAYQGIHGGKLPKSDSFVEVDAKNVIVSAIKYSETGNDIIVRCVETNGTPVTAKLNLLFINQSRTIDFRPCEIKTLLINPKTGMIKETNLLEE